MLTTNEIHIRDPFILPCRKEKTYYLYGTIGTAVGTKKASNGFNYFRSTDLIHWDGPFPAFRPDNDFWSDRDYWAPEVHEWKGSYYMFASFHSGNRRRGTQILRARSPEGPFTPFTEGPVTPAEWECLDGTLYIDSDNQPWMVFCHEWLQISDGAICAIPLSESLDSAVGDPILLFHATSAPWVSAVKDGSCFVTDGPWLYRSKTGQLLMMWSSFGKNGYAIGCARSESGNIHGPWIQSNQPIEGKDGGHGMLFHTFEDELMLTIHQPNAPTKERPVIYPVQDKGDTIHIMKS